MRKIKRGTIRADALRALKELEWLFGKKPPDIKPSVANATAEENETPEIIEENTNQEIESVANAPDEPPENPMDAMAAITLAGEKYRDNKIAPLAGKGEVNKTLPAQISTASGKAQEGGEQ